MNDPTKKCRSCGRPVQWAITAAGRKMPVDPDPVPNGNLVLKDDGNGDLRCAVVPASPYTRRHVSHFATCPNAKGHRKP